MPTCIGYKFPKKTDAVTEVTGGCFQLSKFHRSGWCIAMFIMFSLGSHNRSIFVFRCAPIYLFPPFFLSLPPLFSFKILHWYTTKWHSKLMGGTSSPLFAHQAVTLSALFKILSQCASGNNLNLVLFMFFFFFSSVR